MNDLDEVRDLVETWIRFWGVPDGTTFPRMQEWMTGPTLDLQLDSRSYWDDGALVAFGLVSVPPSEARQIVALLAGVVAPDRRGEGIGTDLLTWQLGRSRRRLIESGSEFPMFIRAWAWNWFDDTRGLFEHHGLSAARQFDVMEKTISGREAIDVPKGIAIVPWDTDRVEEIRVVNNTAFADHWGAVPISDVNWSHLLN